MQLRKGRSLVLESDHTVILGWNPQIFTVISELVESNTNRKEGAVIVVMADHDKIEMEDAIHERVPDTKNTRVIAVNMPNRQDIGINSPWRNFRVNVKQVEAQTGLDFFTNVRPQLRRILKTKIDTQ